MYRTANHLTPARWLLPLLCLFAADGVFAATCVSNGTGGGLWSNPSTWTSCGGDAPGNNDSVTIQSGDTVVLDVDTPTLRDVVIQGGGLLRGDGTGKVLTAGRTGGENITNDSIIDFSGANYAVMKLSQASAWGGSGTYDLAVIDLNTKALTFTSGDTFTLELSAATPILNPGSIGCLATLTFAFSGNVAQTLPTATGICYGNILVTNTAGVTLGVALTNTNMVGNLTVAGNGILNNGGFGITLASGKSFALQDAGTINLTGTSALPTVSGGGTKTYNTTAPCSTVNYGGANQTISNEAYGHLTLGGSGTKTMPGSAMTVACNFTMAGTAAATAAQNLIVGGNFDVSTAGATFSAATFSHQVKGNFSRAGTFNANTSTFTFNGTTAQSITGATTFRNLVLDNAAGLTLNNDTTASNLLTFTNGKITTAGASKMIIGTSGSHTGSSSARYVIGTMEKTGPVGTYTYAIGDATNHTPVNVAFTSGGATGALAASTTSGEHPDIATSGLDPALNVNRYWTLASTALSGTYNATFNFVTGDKDVGSDHTVYEVMRYASGWNATTVGTRAATSTQATGLTGFGAFAIGEILPPVDHYLISHDGSMVTCLAEDITFSVHTASHGLVEPDAGQVLSIATTTGRGTWTQVVAPATGTLGDPTPGNPDNGDATYIFPGAESSVTLRLRYTNPATDPELVNFNVTDSNAKTEATGTAAGDADDANLSVSTTGFQFYNSTDANTTFPVQIAGKRSDEGFGAKALALRAVRASDSDPAVCAAQFTGSVNVQIGAECRNPSTCAGQQVSVDTNDGVTLPAPVAIATSNDNGAAGAAGYTSVALTFGASSTAPLHVHYPDAGQVQLHARYDLGNPAGTYMTGSSNDYVVRPFGFNVVATGNPAATNQNGTVYTAAGADFTVTVTAKGWQSADDGNNDGIPDGHASADTDPTNNDDLSDNTTLQNFGQESGGGEDVALSAALEQPAGGTNPGLAGGTSITSFTSGTGSTATARYGEVGIIELGAVIADGDYLGIGATPTGLARSKSGRVGRFRPDNFNVTGNTPALAPGCNADTTDFTYLEQPFAYATAPQLTITARNVQNATTVNYDGAWWKLGDIALTYAHDGDALPGGTTLDSAAAMQVIDVDCSAGNCDGVTAPVLSGPFTYTRTVTPAAPFDAALDITLGNVTDTDGAAFPGNPFKFEDIEFTGSANQQRWGRIQVGQAVGDPALVLDVPITTEYYNGTAFAQNADDDCTAFNLVNDVALANEATPGSPLAGNQTMNIGAGTTSVTSGNGLLANGLDTMTFSAPGSSNTGLVDILLDLDTGTGADLPWLYFDWDDDGSFDTNTEGRASFGIHSRPDSVIYLREPW